jgi:hemoglobin
LATNFSQRLGLAFHNDPLDDLYLLAVLSKGIAPGVIHLNIMNMQQPVGDNSSSKDVEFDLAFPPIPIPSPSVLAAAGEPLLRALIKCQHERLRNSSIGNLFPADPDAFSSIVERIATFVVETISGSPRIAQPHGPTWFRARHLPMTIDETARNVWLAAMLFAFDDVGFPEEARLEFWNWVEALSIRAINRRTMIGQPRRYPLTEALTALRPFSSASRQK